MFFEGGWDGVLKGGGGGRKLGKKKGGKKFFFSFCFHPRFHPHCLL